MIKGIDFYLNELKRIKPLFKKDMVASEVIKQLLYYGYNQKRLEKTMKNPMILICRNEKCVHWTDVKYHNCKSNKILIGKFQKCLEYFVDGGLK